MDYYLYSHSNADGIFYIGKGQGSRSCGFGRGKAWQEKAKNGYYVKYEAHGSEKDILDLERLLIETLSKLGVKLTNQMYNTGWKPWNFGKKMSSEQRAKLSKALSGKSRPPHSEETKRKMSESAKNRRYT